MTTRNSDRKPKPKAAEPDTPTVTVQVVEPHAVYWDREQRTGTLHGVPADAGAHWQRHGWATINAPSTGSQTGASS